MNLTEFSKVIKRSPEAVRLAIQAGRLEKSVRDIRKPGSKNAKYDIDPVLGKAEWVENTDEGKAYNVRRPDGASRFDDAEIPIGADDELDADLDDDQDLSDVPILTRKDAEKRLDIAKAQMMELKVAQARGELVQAGQVRDEAFRLARIVRDSILNIPDRVAAEFAGLTDAHDIHTRLTQELRMALELLVSGDA